MLLHWVYCTQDVLSQTPIKNLDTGETIQLSQADEHLPRPSINPLSLHMMKLAEGEKSVVSPGDEHSDGESVSSKSVASTSTQRSIKRR